VNETYSSEPMIDVPAYLERIGYSGPTSPTSDVLRGLHRAHLVSVPFENLDIARGRKILCNPDAFIKKIVNKRRGGFCYELNGAFAALLAALGFQVSLLSARVPREDGTNTPEFDHLALRVDFAEPWLADVGFGDSFLDPLRLQAGLKQAQDGHHFRIAEREGSLGVERMEQEGSWKVQYSFTLRPRHLAEFAPMCDYHQTSPESPFTRKRLCTKPTPEGRVTLSDRKLIVTNRKEKTETLLDSEEEWRTALRTYFGVVL
jgi:N-hydroxyarylamine O-acetyltransferase